MLDEVSENFLKEILGEDFFRVSISKLCTFLVQLFG